MNRVKVLLSALLALCITLPAGAHDDGFDHVKIGVGGGLNAGNTTSFNMEGLYELDSYSGFFLGPQLDLRLTRHLGIGSALFIQKDELSFGDSHDAVTLSSLQIPVNVSLALLRSEVLSLLLEGGPQYMYRTDEKRVQFDNGTLTFADYALSINIGAVVEVGDAVRVGARINIPTSGYATVMDTMSDVSSIKMSTLQITAAILF